MREATPLRGAGRLEGKTVREATPLRGAGCFTLRD